MSDVNWNVFRYGADYLHFGGMVLGVAAVTSTKSVDGFSWKTQVLYQLVYFTRYLDVFTEHQTLYLFFFKITFNLVTAAMLTFFVIWRHTYDVIADSCNLVALIAPAIVAAHVCSSGHGLKEELWTFSEFLEPVALVPQYIVCYRAKRIRMVALLYVLAVGGYRILYICNWAYKRYKWHSAYHDYVSWFGGILECMLFVDFVLRIAERKEVIMASPVGRALLTMDENSSRLSEKIELSSIGRRLPFGVSGPGTVLQGQLGDSNWDADDRLAEEEGCGLLTLDGDVDDNSYGQC